MKQIRKRIGALALAGAMSAALLTPAASAAQLDASYDESYYATLDYYGGLMDSSVVKSYRTNGQSVITDHGSYTGVTNLTNDLLPTVENNTVTFRLGEDAPDKFYFEGKTEQPFRDLPWTISVSYQLNGVPVLAEDLAGEKGLVEIDLDVLPNPDASEYSRNNLVLTAAAAFNDDDILSLEAPGAEVQLIGNLRCALFMVLPGEEQHFAIRVGSDAFSFSGLILLAVPATLQQLDQIADLREAKGKVEDSYTAINDSLDIILNTLDGMSGSLNATANGLDQLNSARGTVSAGKGEVYGKTDLALSDADTLAGSLGNMDQYLATASQAVTDATGVLNQLNASVQSMKPELENTRTAIAAIQKDTAALSQLLTDVERYNKKATAVSSSLANELEDLNTSLSSLELSLDQLESALNNTKGISRLNKLELISVAGMTSKAEVLAKWSEVKAAHAQYQAALDAGLLPEGTSFRDGVILSAYQQYLAAAGKSPDEVPLDAFLATEQGQQAAQKAQDAETFYNTVQDMGGESELVKQLDRMDEINGMIPSINSNVIPAVNGKITEINNLITGLTKPTANVVGELSDLCGEAGDTGISGDLSSLAGLCRDLLKTMKKYEGTGASALKDLDEAGSIVSRITQTAGAALDQLGSLTDILNTYEPSVQSALTDAQTLSASAQATLRDTVSALSSAEGLLKSAGPDLDAGTRQTLSGLSSALRRSTSGLSQTGTIRSAKDTVNDLIEDEWDSHTGGENNLLLMDAGAVPESMTSSLNAAPGNVQYIMRTQEIRAEEDSSDDPISQKQTDTRSVWQRITDMFKDLWNSFIGLFKKD